MAVLNIDVNLDDKGNVKIKQLTDSTEKLGKQSHKTSQETKNLAKNLAISATAYLSVSKAIEATVKVGFEYNRQMENQVNGIKALVVATSSNVSAMGKQLSVQEKYTLATRDANEAMRELEKINASTPHTLNETTQIYKAMYVGMSKLGVSSKEMVGITEKLSIAAGASGIQFQQLLAGVDGLASGMVMPNSELGRFLGSLGLTNDALKNTDDIVGLLNSRLGQFTGADTMDVAVSNLSNSWSKLNGELAKDMFKSTKEGIKGTSKLLDDLLKQYKDFKVEIQNIDELNHVDEINTKVLSLAKEWNKYNDRYKNNDYFLGDAWLKKRKEIEGELLLLNDKLATNKQITKELEKQQKDSLVADNGDPFEIYKKEIEANNKYYADLEAKSFEEAKKALEEYAKEKYEFEKQWTASENEDIIAQIKLQKKQDNDRKKAQEEAQKKSLQFNETIASQLGNSMSSTIINIFDGDADVKDAIKGFSQNVGNALVSQVSASLAQTLMQNASIGLAGAGAIGIGALAVTSLIDSFDKQSQEEARKKAELEAKILEEKISSANFATGENIHLSDYKNNFKNFIDGLDSATQKLYDFGNDGDAFVSKLTQLQNAKNQQEQEKQDLQNKISDLNGVKQASGRTTRGLINDFKNKTTDIKNTVSPAWVDTRDTVVGLVKDLDTKARTPTPDGTGNPSETLNINNSTLDNDPLETSKKLKQQEEAWRNQEVKNIQEDIVSVAEEIGKTTDSISDLIKDNILNIFDFSDLDIETQRAELGNFDLDKYKNTLNQINQIGLDIKNAGGVITAKQEQQLEKLFKLPEFIKGENYSSAVKAQIDKNDSLKYELELLEASTLAEKLKIEREAELSKLTNSANIILQKRIWSLEDEKEATEKATKAQLEYNKLITNSQNSFDSLIDTVVSGIESTISSFESVGDSLQGIINNIHADDKGFNKNNYNATLQDVYATQLLLKNDVQNTELMKQYQKQVSALGGYASNYINADNFSTAEEYNLQRAIVSNQVSDLNSYNDVYATILNQMLDTAKSSYITQKDTQTGIYNIDKTTTDGIETVVVADGEVIQALKVGEIPISIGDADKDVVSKIAGFDGEIIGTTLSVDTTDIETWLGETKSTQTDVGIENNDVATYYSGLLETHPEAKFDIIEGVNGVKTFVTKYVDDETGEYTTVDMDILYTDADGVETFVDGLVSDKETTIDITKGTDNVTDDYADIKDKDVTFNFKDGETPDFLKSLGNGSYTLNLDSNGDGTTDFGLEFDANGALVNMFRDSDLAKDGTVSSVTTATNDLKDAILAEHDRNNKRLSADSLSTVHTLGVLEKMDLADITGMKWDSGELAKYAKDIQEATVNATWENVSRIGNAKMYGGSDARKEDTNALVDKGLIAQNVLDENQHIGEVRGGRYIDLNNIDWTSNQGWSAKDWLVNKINSIEGTKYTKKDFASAGFDLMKKKADLELSLLPYFQKLYSEKQLIQNKQELKALKDFILLTQGTNIDNVISSHTAFSNGGFTPNVGKYTPAGVVHGGEYVAPMEQVAKFPELFSYLDSTRGYADGGLVNTTIPIANNSNFGGTGQMFKELKDEIKALKDEVVELKGYSKDTAEHTLTTADELERTRRATV